METALTQLWILRFNFKTQMWQNNLAASSLLSSSTQEKKPALGQYVTNISFVFVEEFEFEDVSNKPNNALGLSV